MEVPARCKVIFLLKILVSGSASCSVNPPQANLRPGLMQCFHLDMFRHIGIKY